MNASMADFDNIGAQGHLRLQCTRAPAGEDSMLWMNDGLAGAASGDMNLDGKLDILQANGMVGDKYNDLYEGYPNYWY